MTNKTNIADRVRKIIIELLDADPDKVVDTASMIDDLGLDSLDHVELILSFEEEFDIEIPDDDAEKWKTVGAIIKYVEGKLKS